MIDYVKKMVEDFPEQELKKGATTPAAIHLFIKTRDNCKKLSEDKAQMFHNMVARGLFVSKRARADIQPTIAFLCTRVSEPDEDDWKKLVRLMSYLRRTKHVVATLSANDMTTLRWDIDASHAVHPDGKGHTGGALTLDQGAAYNQSTKQKLNTRSSTESELVGADD